MTERVYLILRDLFNESNADFWALPDETHAAYFKRLYAK